MKDQDKQAAENYLRRGWDQDFIEKHEVRRAFIAGIEHQQWCQWAKKILDEEPGISQSRRQRWVKLMVPYNDLPEEWKEYDREWARQVLWKVKASLTDFLEKEKEDE